MHWEILIIPLIALGVWILGTLFKGGEDAAAKKGVRRPAGRAPARRPVTDLDHFLEEARRRREMEERRAVPVPPPPPPPRPTVSRPPLSDRPARPRPTAPRPTPPVPRRSEPIPVAVPVAEAVPEVLPVEAISVLGASPPPPPSFVRQAALSPIAQQVRSMLSKPQTAGAAFILREIFDRPMCKRL